MRQRLLARGIGFPSGRRPNGKFSPGGVGIYRNDLRSHSTVGEYYLPLLVPPPTGNRPPFTILPRARRGRDPSHARSDSRPPPCSMTSSMLTLLPMRSKTMFRNMVARSQEDFHTQPTKGNRGGEPIAGTGVVSPWPAGPSGSQLADATYYPPLGRWSSYVTPSRLMKTTCEYHSIKLPLQTNPAAKRPLERTPPGYVSLMGVDLSQSHSRSRSQSHSRNHNSSSHFPITILLYI